MQTILLTTESNTFPYTFIKRLPGVEDVNNYLDGLIYWNILTKYYKTRVSIKRIDKELVSTFNNKDYNLNVYLHIIDLKDYLVRKLEDIKDVFLLNCLEGLEKICVIPVHFLEEFYEDLILWSVKHGIQIIKCDILNKSIEEEDEGFEQLLQALYAHSWPDMVKNMLPNIVDVKNTKNNNNEDDLEGVEENSKNINELDSMTFEELFENLGSINAQAKNLPRQQQKMLAEKVALSFWKAVGGDESEIAGLSDNE